MKQFKRLALAVCVIFALPVQVFGFQVKVTAYAADPRCTKRIHPNVTSSEHRITRGDYGHLIALSADLARHYQYGDVFLLKVGKRVFRVKYEDRMPRRDRGKYRIDFLLPDFRKCVTFGVHRGNLILIQREERGERYGCNKTESPRHKAATQFKSPLRPDRRRLRRRKVELRKAGLRASLKADQVSGFPYVVPFVELLSKCAPVFAAILGVLAYKRAKNLNHKIQGAKPYESHHFEVQNDLPQFRCSHRPAPYYPTREQIRYDHEKGSFEIRLRRSKGLIFALIRLYPLTIIPTEGGPHASSKNNTHPQK